MSKQPTPPPPGDKPAPAAPPPPPAWRHWLWPAALLAALVLFLVLPRVGSPPVNLSYSTFLSDVTAHKVKTFTLENSAGSTAPATGTLTNGDKYTTVIPLPFGGTPLESTLQKSNVQIDAAAPSAGFGTELLYWLILLAPFILVFWLFRRMSRASGGAGPMGGLLGVGRARAKVFDAERPQTKFADVAGYESAKAEVSEVVDFLKNPERYRRLGAMAPRGVLMVGPPGTGKTLLARAVAGEADVPFISVTGSSFVEMFVGVGAARVRDLFMEARKRAPAIIFVDEVDAIGQRRAGGGALVANDEREQTLNQLLSEMDGFDISQGIVVLAATNRPEVLDPALLRPGRFDRRITIPLPNLSERRAILKVHCRGKHLAPDVDLDVAARGTPGFSGADLANLVNEAAIFAVRAGRENIAMADFDAARDRILLGSRADSNLLLPEEKRAVAVHESGHALVAALLPHADPVAKVTILPSGQALGVTQQLPLVERHLYGEDYLTESLAVRLGGRAAELVEMGQGSTGAANDLASATELAIKMVREFGLSGKLGPVGYPEGGSVFLGGGGPGLSSRPYAEATQAVVDAEVARLLREAEEYAVSLIREHRDELRRLADLLVEKETVDGEEVYRLFGVPVPEHRPEGQAIGPARIGAPAHGPATPAHSPAATAPGTAHSPAATAPGTTRSPAGSAPGAALGDGASTDR
ncbi:MAG TPA: ATP-dependent zinc metalloprotease FtsH [Streptosporangiaceae bacterium]|nr:ATP-dependent zinc metalloprotease FtsH [Streptosporangiaceae bacterium]